MRAPSGLGRAPVVATVTRSGLVESVHHGIVVATDNDTGGSVIFGAGPHDIPIYPRSANKPMQAIAMLRSALVLDGPLLTLASASHNGEAMHLDGVREILALADEGLTEDDLRNTPDYPLDEQAKADWLAHRQAPSSIAQNCSGKHAAMLVTCIASGWDTTTYLAPDHRLQRAMAATIEEFSGEPVAATGIDGCGAPAMAISLAGLARAFGKIASAPGHTPAGRVARAICAYPRMLGGTGRDVSALIEAVPGLIAKDGAESVYAVGLPDGRGLAVKIADGGQRARAAVTVKALEALGLEKYADSFAALSAEPILGHGKPVGAVEAVNLHLGSGST